jgi:hypothetical protein
MITHQLVGLNFKGRKIISLEVLLFLVPSLSWDIIYLPIIFDIPVHVTFDISLASKM